VAADERERPSRGERLRDAINELSAAAGTMEASVAQFPAEMGRAAIESAVKVIHGEKLPEDIKVKLELVTRDNAK